MCQNKIDEIEVNLSNSDTQQASLGKQHDLPIPELNPRKGVKTHDRASPDFVFDTASLGEFKDDDLLAAEVLLGKGIPKQTAINRRKKRSDKASFISNSATLSLKN